MNVTSNSTTTDTDNGLTGGALFLVILSATSAWCVFIMCIVCCSEYRSYKRRGRNTSYQNRRNGQVEATSYTDKKEHISLGVTLSANIQQDLSTFSPSEEITNSFLERRDGQTDTFNDQNQLVENDRSLDLPTPKTKKTLLPPINVGTFINVDTKCHGDTSSPSKETLLDNDKPIRNCKKSQLTPVIVHT